MLNLLPCYTLIALIGTPLALAAPPESVLSAGKAVYVDAPDDNSGKSLDADVLGSLHEELQSDLAKSKKIVGKSDAQVFVHVEVTDFHMRPGASRWMLGSLSGKDHITSKVTLVDSASGATLYATEVTTSTANQYRGESSIARLHADEIAKALGVQP